MGPSLEVLAIQAEQIRQQIRALQDHAREVFARQEVEREITVGECHAIDLLLGQVGAAFRCHAKRQAGPLTDADRAQAAEAGGRA
jgi:hypothetical protein